MGKPGFQQKKVVPLEKNVKMQIVGGDNNQQTNNAEKKSPLSVQEPVNQKPNATLSQKTTSKSPTGEESINIPNNELTNLKVGQQNPQVLSQQKLNQEIGQQNGQLIGVKNPQETSLPNPQAIGQQNPQETGQLNPQAIGLENPLETV